jgi:hypothetical protein
MPKTKQKPASTGMDLPGEGSQAGGSAMFDELQQKYGCYENTRKDENTLLRRTHR